MVVRRTYITYVRGSLVWYCICLPTLGMSTESGANKKKASPMTTCKYIGSLAN